MGTILAIANQKGGVGKSTTVLNLGDALAERGHSPLMVDFDPAAGLTRMVGLDPTEAAATSYSLVLDPSTAKAGLPVRLSDRLSVIPANEDLVGAEKELPEREPFGWHQSLRTALAVFEDDHDVVLVDCPPGRGVLAMMGVASADAVLSPLETHFIALDGLHILDHLLAQVREIRPELQRLIVRTKYDPRTRHDREVFEVVEERFPGQVAKATIPSTVRFRDASIEGKSILAFDSKHRGAQAYRALAEEIEDQWLQKIEQV